MKIIKMGYSIEPRNTLYAKGYGFLSFTKNIDKKLSNKLSAMLLVKAIKTSVVW